ncbi:MAG: ATP-binding protein [Spirochaetales bacterium]|nr:ATP-binding protein [Spirochaetales bacterium]
MGGCLLIPRKEYLDFLIRVKDLHLIKVISGIRRCGKSTLFELYRDYLIKQNISDKQMIFINFEDLVYDSLRDYKSLYEYIKPKINADKMTYIFLDEIQHVSEFERVVDSLFIQKNVDIYITGSNAYFMSGELATLLSGRYIELKMLPLSFGEYCIGETGNRTVSEKYGRYLVNSSFPYTVRLGDQRKVIVDYLQGLYNTVILKDVIARYKITDVMMLEDVARFLFDSIGNQTSITKVANTMTSHGRKIDPKTVEKYVSALRDSLIIYKAKRYNIKGKQYLKTLEKYYVVDIGLRYMLLGRRNPDVGHILENIIYLELIRRGYDVYVGQVGDLEVDFVAMNEEGITYYQVAATVREESTLKRELASLQKIKDHYPKFILTLDDDPEADYDGIRRINALSFLLENYEIPTQHNR